MFDQKKCKRINCQKLFTPEHCLQKYCSPRCVNNEQQLRSKRKKRKEILKILGNKCIRCGFSDKRALQIDHVNGGGCKELRSKNQLVYCRQVLKELEAGSKKYQLLCANCNWIKRAENKEHS